MLFAPTLDTNNACSLVYDRTRNTISLAYDNPANGAAPLIPGSSTVVSNHQCTLRGANSTVVGRDHLAGDHRRPRLQRDFLRRQERLSLRRGKHHKFRLGQRGRLDRDRRSAHGRFRYPGVRLGFVAELHLHRLRFRVRNRTSSA